MTIMKTKNLTKRYGNQTAASELNIEIRAGELTAYLGTNGAGKSTTIRMLTGTLPPTSGTIYYHGEGLTKIKPAAFKVGVVFQDSILDLELTVRQNLNIRRALYHAISKSDLEKLMEQTEIVSFADKRYGELSGGMRRKVDITRALLNQPEILFLDEPTTGLDVQSRREIWSLLNKLKDEQQLAIFLTTHYLEEAESADHIYILEEGKIVENGSAAQLKEKYGQMTLWIKTKNNQQFFEKAAADSPLLDDEKGVGFKLSSSQAALLLLQKYQSDVEFFVYQPVEMTDIFLTLTRKGAAHASHYEA
jgi:multidrug/hemolysin transport system ATP-binding protein